MKLVDSRRLTGPNLYGRKTGAVAQIEFGAEERPEDILSRWEGAVREASEVLGWSEAKRHVRRFTSDDGVEGAALLVEAGLEPRAARPTAAPSGSSRTLPRPAAPPDRRARPAAARARR